MKNETFNTGRFKKCIILVYFGNTPNYFQIFLRSCLLNSDFDFHFFGDVFSDKQDNNLFFHRFSFPAFKQRLRDLLGFEPSLETPYKICDFRPLFGLIFGEYISAYDFWAFCDCDLVFGRLSHFLSDDLFTKYEKILTRGHLSFFKNNDEMNYLWKHQVSINEPYYYELVFRDSKNHSFDEWNGIKKILIKAKIPFFDEMVFDDIRVKYGRFLPTSLQKNEIYKDFFYVFSQEGLFRCHFENRCLVKEETLYIHLQKRPMHIDSAAITASTVFIYPNRFRAIPHNSFGKNRRLMIYKKDIIHFKLITLKRRFGHLFKKVFR